MMKNGKMRKMYRYFESRWFGLAASVAVGVPILSVLKTPQWLTGQNAVEGTKKTILARKGTHVSGYGAQ